MVKKFNPTTSLKDYHATLRQLQQDVHLLEALDAFQYPAPIPTDCPQPATDEETLATQLDYFRRIQQYQGFSFLENALHRHGGALLNAYMGHGKTYVALLLTVHYIRSSRSAGEPLRPVLLVAAPAVQAVWQSTNGDGHVQKHLGEEMYDELKLLNIRDTLKDQRVAEINRVFAADVPCIVMCSYEFARGQPWLLARHWGLVVCDEVQKLKNPSTGVSKAFALHLHPDAPRVGLSGTYNTNRPGPNTIAVLSQIAPSLVAQYKNEAGQVSVEDLRDLELALVYKVAEPQEAKRATTQTIRWVELGDAQPDYEERTKKVESTYSSIASDPKNKEQQAAYAAAIQKLRRTTNCQTKMDAVVADLCAFHARRSSSAPERRVVVVSNNLESIEAIGADLEDRGIKSVPFTGELSHKERDTVLARWKTGEGPGTLLLSTDTGCEGIDLTATDTMFLVDLISEYNPGKHDQVLARIDRHGQSSPVVHYTYYGVKYTFDSAIEYVRTAKRKARRAIRKGKDAEVDTGVMRALKLVHGEAKKAPSADRTAELHPTDYKVFSKRKLEDVFPDCDMVTDGKRRRTRGLTAFLAKEAAMKEAAAAKDDAPPAKRAKRSKVEVVVVDDVSMTDAPVPEPIAPAAPKEEEAWKRTKIAKKVTHPVATTTEKVGDESAAVEATWTPLSGPPGGSDIRMEQEEWSKSEPGLEALVKWAQPNQHIGIR